MKAGFGFLSLAGLSSILLLGASSQIASAASTWTGNQDTFWTNSLNWAGNAPPAPGTDIIFSDTINQTVDLGINQTIGSLTFFAPDLYTLNNFTLTLGGNLSQFLNGSVTINSGLDTGGLARQFSNSGTGEVTVGGVLSGAGAITLAGGNFTLTNAANANTGGLNINAGRLTLGAPAGLTLSSAAGVSQVGTGAININGGQLRLLPGGAGTVGDIGRPVVFGATGGTLNYAGNPGNGAALSLNVTSASGTPATILNGTANIAADGTGWSASAPGINLNSLIGGGTARFQFTNGALLRFNATSTTNAVIFAGHASGNVLVGSTNPTVGRLLFPGGVTNTIGGGLTFQNFNQVTVDSGANTVDASLTIGTGSTAFAGGGSAVDTSKSLILGLPGSSRTLTIQSGGTAVFDLQNRADAAFQGGVVVNMPTVIAAGGTLSITRTLATNNNPAVTPAVGTITFNRTITGSGTAASESVLDLKLTGADVASGVQYASNIVVNGTGTGGLRVQGTSANVDNFLSPTRIQGLTGSGGTLTMAYSDNGSRVINAALAPSITSSVRLGFDKQGTGAPTYTLGAVANDLVTWNGIVVKGGTVNVGTSQSFLGALDMTGGTLNVNGANLAFAGVATLTGGTLALSNQRVLTANQVFGGAGVTFSGSGRIGSSVLAPTTLGGTLSPGINSATNGTLQFTGGLILSNLTALKFDLDVPNVVGGGTNDLVQAIGNLTLDGLLTVTGSGNFNVGTYTLFTYSGTLTNNTMDLGTMPSGFNYSVGTPAGSVTLVVSAIPEPTTYGLLGLGLSALWFVRRGRRS